MKVNLKKAIGALLASVMLFGTTASICMLNTAVVFAADKTEDDAFTGDFICDFRDMSNITNTSQIYHIVSSGTLKYTAAQTDASASDLATVTGVKYHGDIYGVQGTMTIQIPVTGNAKLYLGTADYGLDNATLTTTAGGKFYDADGYAITKVSTSGNSAGKNKSITGSTGKVIYYKAASETETATLTISGSQYFSGFAKDTITDTALNAIIKDTTPVSLTVKNLDSVAQNSYVAVSNGSTTTYTQLTNGSAAFQASSDTTYRITGIYGGSSAYTVPTNSFTSTDGSLTIEATAVTPTAANSASYNFTDGSVLPKNSDYKYSSFTTSDGVVNITPSGSKTFAVYQDGSHGIQEPGSTFTVYAQPNTIISFLGCKYSGSSTTITYSGTSQNAKTSNCGDSVSFEYNGSEAAYLTFETNGSQYLHGISISQNKTTYTVGPDETYDFTSIADAVEAVNAVGNTDNTVTISVAAGTYSVGDTPLAITRKNVTIIGAGADSTTITTGSGYNTTGSGTLDTSSGQTTHNGTLIVRASGVTLKNLTVQNATHASFNSSALENYSTDLLVSYCTLDATCDTFYTGKADRECSAKIENSTLYGYQDVVYGGGDIKIDTCTFISNAGKYTGADSDTRFFAPTGMDPAEKSNYYNYTYTIENITVKADGSSANKIYFARPWTGTNTSGLLGTLVIDGYTIDTSAESRFNAGVTSQGLYGFDNPNASGSTSPDTSDKANFYVRKTFGSGSYNTSLAKIDKIAASYETAANGSNKNVIVKLNSALAVSDIADDGLTKLDYTVSKGSDKATLTNDTVYNVSNPSDASNDGLYTLNILTSSANGTYTFTPVMTYAGRDIEGSAIEVTM